MTESSPSSSAPTTEESGLPGEDATVPIPEEAATDALVFALNIFDEIESSDSPFSTGGRVGEGDSSMSSGGGVEGGEGAATEAVESTGSTAASEAAVDNGAFGGIEE